nr:M15 family metallopeptidase [Paenibacillus roseus]
MVLIGYGVFEYQQRPAAVEDKWADVHHDPRHEQDSRNDGQEGQDQQGQQDQPEEQAKLTISSDEVRKGSLLLINRQYPVSEDGVLPEIVSLFQRKDLVKGFGILDNSVQLPLDLVQKFSVIVESAKNDGVTHFLITSGYRDNEQQRELYEKMGADYANPAGHSEHNLGLSLDIGSTVGMMKDAPEGKWLEQNAWKYGFVLRYPEDKTDITGVLYEPWHFRYVGLPHSVIMQEHSFVLEQYLDYLKEQRQITGAIDGQTYSVSFYPVIEGQDIQVPLPDQYELSGNNIDGVILTSWDAKVRR